ncbi:hypothetical protein PBI_COLLEEN_46 [Corynebacterium phage Colleen]|uniref:Uncharacterized protein n=4 Tax=root TaxID=1 RepID=W5XXA1_9CORY|nr:hypothetical protein [Corynebacterium vitaeruminis]YP_009626558.1 hypothetical protein FDK28_gp46 [Corynebacterium phage Poushou]AWY06494.1 hypothetical protein PBI_TOUCHMENOT_46 [Corynebacterium phage TouchMeNot]QFG14795.1 hypothetical protein PBI_COLLEEN_46 [Corynebacterium phage Colleen]UVT31932.1 hypothetical protein PBI_ARIANNA_46 [Corynebacterium phage Arianna]AHI21582.1 hypothetical protein B843_00930 [Corynebacterium vitaeruminis DSM 20294]ASJ79005.1 hypothetical protein PBI_POUSHO
MKTGANQLLAERKCPFCERLARTGVCQQCNVYLPWPDGQLRALEALSLRLAPAAKDVVVQTTTQSVYMTIDQAEVLANQLLSLLTIARETDFRPETPYGGAGPLPQFLSPSEEVYRGEAQESVL